MVKVLELSGGGEEYGGISFPRVLVRDSRGRIYLSSDYGRSKGYGSDTPAQLVKGLLEIAVSGRVESTSDTLWGTKYVVVGETRAPNGSLITLRTHRLRIPVPEDGRGHGVLVDIEAVFLGGVVGLGTGWLSGVMADWTSRRGTDEG